MAREFLFLLTNKENQLEFSKLTNVLPANRYALEDKFFKCNNSKNLIDIGRCTSAKQLDNLGTGNFGYKNKKAINDTLNKALETYILQDNLKALYEAINKVKTLQEN
jgi:ABC-type glycerol-3-phosphate transport system substrate-binding protein